jgi:hypothetical protein
MGIKAIKAIEPEANLGILEVDLSEWAGEGAVVRFRQPKAADIFPDGAGLKALQVAYPEMPRGMLVNIAIVAKCYVADIDDPGDEPFVRVLGHLSRSNRKAFFHLYEAFVDKFLAPDIVAEVEEAKNA